MKPIAAALALLIATTAAQGQARGPSQEYNGELAQRRSAQPASTDRIIIKWRGSAIKGATAAARSQKATAASGVSLQKQQSMTDDIDVMRSQQELSGAALDAVIQRLQADPSVEYASPDLRRHSHALPSDPQLPNQWYLLGDQPAATRTHLAWDTTHGSATTIVAVLDTGVRFEHPELNGKLLAGYDFVSDIEVANDGDGRDADPTDPGDWVSTTDLQTPDFRSCELSNSSWHGTRVSGLIGAVTDNAIGVAGAAWDTQVLPVRVLGKCGGFDSDIIAGMRWAAGLTVAGIPANPNPAKIINLSLGGTGACSAAYQSTVSEITAQGILIVVSAGNEGGPVAAPANCSGVLGVAGIRHIGTKVGFSSLGTQIGIGAPGGNCVNTEPGQPCLFSIIVAVNTGTTVPVASGYTNQFNFNVGTSFSAPLAAAAAALVRSVNSALTPAQIINVLKKTATEYPTSGSTGVQACRVPISALDFQTEECACTTQTCGAGMLNTNAAVAVTAAQGPVAIVSTNGSVTPGTSLVLDGTSSFAGNGGVVASFQWSILNVTGSAPVLAAPTDSITTLQITGNGTFTLRLTVADGQGVQDMEDLALATATVTPPPSPPQNAPSGGGGGGSLGWEIFGLALLGLRRRKQVMG